MMHPPVGYSDKSVRIDKLVMLTENDYLRLSCPQTVCCPCSHYMNAWRQHCSTTDLT